MRIALIGFFSFVFALALTQVIKLVAWRAGAVAGPTSERWHRRPVALLGGVAIAVTVFSLAPLAVEFNRESAAFIAGGAFLFVLGLVDDLRPLRPQAKLIAQILLASVLAGLGLQLHLTPYPFLNVLVTLFWVVGITNAFNLLDNMDGLAAGIAVITMSFRLGFFLMDGNSAGAALTAVFIGAVLGFLVHNFSPASIFMGDAGSLFIGFSVSGLSLFGGYPYSRGVLSVLLFPVLILLVPIFDTTFVTISRYLARRPISVGGRDHTSHRLVALGLTERRAVVSLYFVALLSGTVAYLSYRFGFSYTLVFVTFLTLGVGVLGVYLSQTHVYPEESGAAAPPEGVVFHWVRRFTHKRQIVTVFIDLALVCVAYYTAYLLRFEQAVVVYQSLIVQSLPVVIACQMAAFGFFRVYQGVWRYTGLRDAIRLIQAASVGTGAAVTAIVYLYRFEGYSRAVFVLDWILVIAFVAASRLSLRMLIEMLRPRRSGQRRTVIYGAGDGGVLVLREINGNRALGRTLVGFIDDDPRKQGRQVQGVPILGGCDDLERILLTDKIDEVLIASPKISPAKQHRLTVLCDSVGVAVLRATFRLE